MLRYAHEWGYAAYCFRPSASRDSLTAQQRPPAMSVRDVTHELSEAASA
jgi:hypothetical protein